MTNYLRDPRGFIKTEPLNSWVRRYNFKQTINYVKKNIQQERFLYRLVITDLIHVLRHELKNMKK